MRLIAKTRIHKIKINIYFCQNDEQKNEAERVICHTLVLPVDGYIPLKSQDLRTDY